MFILEPRHRSIGLNYAQILKSTRHPNVLKFIDFIEKDLLYLVTERVIPLEHRLHLIRENEEETMAGIFQIAVRLF